MNETKTTELIGKPLTVEMASNHPHCFLHRPEGGKAFFAAYQASHRKNIQVFKQVNPNS